MASLEEQFEEASAHFAPINQQFSDKAKLKMYALHNQATRGDVTGPAPSRMEVVKFAKYSARKRCFGMPKNVAMRRYISELRALDPSFALTVPEEDKEVSNKSSKTLIADFEKATAFVREKGTNKIPKAQWYLLYAYFKQSTEGVCNRPQPGRFASTDRNARWKAWANLFDMPKPEAMLKYLEMVQKTFPTEVIPFKSTNPLQASLSRNKAKMALTDADMLKIKKEDEQIMAMMIDVSLDDMKQRFKMALDSNSDVIFFTGGSGFIGKHLMDVLLNPAQHLLLDAYRHRAGLFGRYMDRMSTKNEASLEGFQGKHPLLICLTREGSERRMAEQVLDRNGREAADKVIVLPFVLDSKNFGLDENVFKFLQSLKFGTVNENSLKSNEREQARLFHLAAKYSLVGGEEESIRANVEGTQCTVDFCKTLGLKLDYVSSVVVSGDYDGMFLETSFDEGQEFSNHYARSKFEAEKYLRENCNGLRYTIYRPGVVVGHSVTGEADKIDGPYYFFKLLQDVRSLVPTSIPLPSIDGESMPVVPVDYVAKAMHHLALACPSEQSNGRTFHLVDSSAHHRPDTFVETLNLFARAAHAPQFSSRAATLLMSLVPRKMASAVQNIPILRDTPLWLAKNVLRIPEEAMQYLWNRSTYDDSDTQLLLSGSGIKCPSLRDYADKLWDFYERHLDLININKPLALEKAVKGKTVMVTGATDGIGLELAKKLSAAKATVLIVARNQEKVDKCVREMRESGGNVKGYIADLSAEEPSIKMLDLVLKENGHVDILVNNAGRSIRRSVEYEWKDSGRFHDFERTMSLNYFGALRCILSLLPRMRERKTGQVINISSIGAAANQARFGAYAASKCALDGFSKCIAAECAYDNVHFSTVYMPLVRTKMIASEGNNYTERYGELVLTTDQACDLIIDAIVTKRRTIAVAWTRAVMVAYHIAPSVVETVNNMIYRLEPETPPKGFEESATAAGDKEQIKAIMGLFKKW